MNLATCHRCPNRQAICAGPCPCTLSGRDIIDHARRGDCPAGKFSTPDAAMPEPQPTRRTGGCCDPSSKLDDGPTEMVNPPTEHRRVRRLPNAPI